MSDAPTEHDPSSQEPEDDATGEEASLSYEVARDRLVETVRALETGGTTLEESLALWETGERLARVCQQHLDGARARLDAVLGSDEDA